MMGWQWHQLDHMQIICTLLQTDKHASNHHSAGLELPPGISPALVTLVPGTAAAKDIPAGDTIYPRLCETVSDNYSKSY